MIKIFDTSIQKSKALLTHPAGEGRLKFDSCIHVVCQNRESCTKSNNNLPSCSASVDHRGTDRNCDNPASRCNKEEGHRRQTRRSPCWHRQAWRSLWWCFGWTGAGKGSQGSPPTSPKDCFDLRPGRQRCFAGSPPPSHCRTQRRTLFHPCQSPSRGWRTTDKDRLDRVGNLEGGPLDPWDQTRGRWRDEALARHPLSARNRQPQNFGFKLKELTKAPTLALHGSQ